MVMTAAITAAFTDAADLLDVIATPVFALAYGSHATGRAGPRSDLDLLYIGETPPTATVIQRLTDEVVALHHRHGLTLDTEVAYATKLHATTDEMTAALALAGFTTSCATRIDVPPVTTDAVYLNSRDFKARLILNAITGPHVFLAGDSARYRACRQTGERAILALATALTDTTVFDVDQAVQALIRDPHTGSTGEDFLGYERLDAAWLFSMINTTAADLAAEGVLIRRPDGRYVTDPATREHLLRHVLHHTMNA